MASKKEQRIALAKDVIRKLRYIQHVEQGYYCRVDQGQGKDHLGQEADLQARLPYIRKNCRVCALGSMFLSYVHLYDEVKVGDIFPNMSDSLRASRPGLTCKLGKLFSKIQLALIEVAFEQSSLLSDVDVSVWQSADCQKAVAFGKQYALNKQRLRAIMLNIIRNDGTFKP